MQVKCSSGHVWDRLPNFPDTRLCPTCGQEAKTDFSAPMIGAITYRTDDDPSRVDPLTRQFLMENRKYHEDLILSGDRGSGAVNVQENGPNWTRPFGNDPWKRREAMERYGR